MRLDEILNEKVDPAGQKLIKDTLLQMAREGNDAAREWANGFGKTRHKIVGDGNLVTVKFMLGDGPHAAGSMRFAGGGKTEDELDFEHKEQRAKDLADELVHRLSDFIHIEDYSIDSNEPGYRPSVNLFMVSDGFMGNKI